MAQTTTRILCLLYLALFSCGVCFSQAQSLSSYLQQIQNESNYEFFYKKSWIDTISVQEITESEPLQAIEQAIISAGLELFVFQQDYVFIYPNRLELEKMRQREEKVQQGYEFKEYIRLGSPQDQPADGIAEIRGRVTNEFGEPLIGVTIVVEELNDGTQTEANGEYLLRLPVGNYRINYHFVGLDSELRRVTVYGHDKLNLALFPEVQYLDEVIVEESSPEQILDERVIGKTDIGLGALEAMPAFLGEPDVLKSATMLPGVTVVGESSSYLNVRGGRNDQTLVLMNNAPVFTPGHVLGFFSVFNGDFVSGVSLYKGNVPARYGTRASSILDVKMNRFGSKDFNFYGGLGLVNTNVGIKTKLLESKLDVHVGGRSSYSNWLFSQVQNKDIVRSAARFGDLNLVSRYVINEKNTIQASGFFGDDFFRFSQDIIYRWQAWNGNVEWNHLFDNGWLYSSRIITSNLRNRSEGLQLNDEFLLESGIRNYQWSNSLNFEIGRGVFDVGFDLGRYVIEPGEIEPTKTRSLTQPEVIETENLVDLAGYLEYGIDLTDRVSINSGIRLTHFSKVGSSTENLYAAGATLDPVNVVGRKTFEQGETISSHFNLEPRLGVNFRWKSRAVKVGFTRTNQYLHLISNTALINPVSVWKGSDQFIRPTTIDQYSIGYVQNMFNDKLIVTLDAYYKNMANLIDYKDGAELILNENIEQVVVGGKGEAYGVELLMTKTSGKVGGWMSYSYSRAFIQPAAGSGSEIINNGERYAYYSDRPHNFQFYLDYKPTKKWTVSANFTYTSGAPTNAPRSVYQIAGVNIPFFQARNSERIPDYHRLDLSITLKSRIRKTKKNNDRWVLSFYNLYGRRNASTVFFRRQDGLPARSFQLISVGSIIPTLTYKFEI